MCTRKAGVGCIAGSFSTDSLIQGDHWNPSLGGHKTLSPITDHFDFLRQRPEHQEDARSLGYVIIDEKGMVKSVNLAALDMLDVDREQLLRAGFFDFIYEEDRGENRFNPDRLTDLANRSFDLRLEKGRELFWVRMSIIFDEETFFSTGLISLVLQDINQQKQTEKENETLRNQLRQTQKMETIGELSGGVAHDLNNILQPIIGNLEMLIEDMSVDRKLRKTLQKILTGANRAGSLVNQILSFRHQEEPEIISVRIQPIIREVIKLSRSTLPSAINIIQTIDNECGPVMADSTHIYQIAMNLITNAFHSMGSDGGILRVNLNEINVAEKDLSDNTGMNPGRYACLSISDTGMGIGPDIIDKIFEPYFTTKEKGTGTGLGLFVIHRIVERYGGDVRVSSTPGKGSLFRVCLPMEKASSTPPGGLWGRQQDLHGCESILFVDDDPFVVDVQKETLEYFGYTVTPCSSGRDALDAFAAGHGVYDIVICDMAMPDFSGLEIAHRIKEIQPDIPVIIWTGFSEQVSEDNYRDMGVDGFLMKPSSKEDCLRLVRRLLDAVPGDRNRP